MTKAICNRLEKLEAKSRPIEGASWDDYDLSKLTEEERAAWDKSRAICNDPAFYTLARSEKYSEFTDEQRAALCTLNELMLKLEAEATQ